MQWASISIYWSFVQNWLISNYDTQKSAADVDKNGSINAVDASIILSYYVYTSTAKGDVMTFEDFIEQ